MKNQVIKAALFDLDGVVVFTDKYHYLAWKKLADENGWEFFAEFKRWFQLQRTERIYDVNHGYTDAFGVQREANPRVRESMDRFGIDRNNRQIYLMPLPSREVMDCGFTQNPSF